MIYEATVISEFAERKRLRPNLETKNKEMTIDHTKSEGASFVDASNVLITILRIIGVNTANKMLPALLLKI